MGSVRVNKLTVLILDKPQVVLGYEMPSLLIVANIGLYHLILVYWVEDKSSVFHKCYELSPNAT